MHALPPTDINDAPNVALGQTLEQPLLAVESCLNLLGEALLRRDTQAIELHASALHQALAEAIAMFSEAARAGQVPPNLRHRLVQAGGRVAAQRAIDVLMPGEATGLYSAMGKSERKTLGGGSYQA
jgi:hypothetical protein